MTISGIHHVTLIVDDAEKASRFYGQVLGLEQKPRPAFKFPGLFYHCGDQEIHLIIASRPLKQEDLFIRIDGISDITRRYIHRHAALVVSDLANLLTRLTDHGVEILLDPRNVQRKSSDLLLTNLLDGWNKMYGTAPIFCLDPFGNLLEIVPGRA